MNITCGFCLLYVYVGDTLHRNGQGRFSCVITSDSLAAGHVICVCVLESENALESVKVRVCV